MRSKTKKKLKRYWRKALRDLKRDFGRHDRLTWLAIGALDPNNKG